MRQRILLYAGAISIPLFLALDAWQASRYTALSAELTRLETAQRDWLENNKRLIAGIAVLSASERIERIARDELGLTKKSPEEVLQILIEDGEGHDG